MFIKPDSKKTSPVIIPLFLYVKLLSFSQHMKNVTYLGRHFLKGRKIAPILGHSIETWVSAHMTLHMVMIIMVASQLHVLANENAELSSCSQ